MNDIDVLQRSEPPDLRRHTAGLEAAADGAAVRPDPGDMIEIVTIDVVPPGPEWAIGKGRRTVLVHGTEIGRWKQPFFEAARGLLRRGYPAGANWGCATSTVRSACGARSARRPSGRLMKARDPSIVGSRSLGRT